MAVKKNGEWKKGIFEKSQVYGSPVQLSNFGIPVTSVTAKHLIQFLSELEAENEGTIPVKKAVSKLGWREGKFVPVSKSCDLIIDLDPKLQKWVQAYNSKGKLEDWIKEIKPYRDNQIYRFILASSFTAPLLKLIENRIFIVYNWGNSRAGKTSALKAALSVWGNPDNLTVTFNTTAVGIERLAGFYNDLPLGIDEKQVNKSQTDLEKLVYMLSSGISKIRGNKTGGVQAMETWNTVVLATGEEPISTTTSTTGVQTRCLEIEGSPYNDEETASKVYSIISKNYGTAGSEFINKLINEYSKNDYEKLKNEFQIVLEKIKSESGNDILSYISSVSAVTLADILIGKWLFNDNEEKSYKMANSILKQLSNSQEIDIVEKCYEHTKSWLVANHRSFDKYSGSFSPSYDKLYPEDDLKESFVKKSFGVYQNSVYYVHRYIYEEFLNNKNYSYKKTIKEFAKRGYILTEKNEDGGVVSNSVQKKIRGQNARVFAFPIEMTEKTKTPEEKKILQEKVQAEVIGKTYKQYKREQENTRDFLKDILEADNSLEIKRPIENLSINKKNNNMDDLEEELREIETTTPPKDELEEELSKIKKETLPKNGKKQRK